MIEALQGLLTDELTAIDQYSPTEGRAKVKGFGVFSAYVAERTDDEQKHAKALIKRIFELEGVPDTVKRNTVLVSQDLNSSLGNDKTAELGAIAKLNAAIEMAVDLGDNATREMLVDILKDEDEHLQDIEQRQGQIVTITAANFWAAQIG